MTTRQVYEQHVSDPACAGCHGLIDPIGFGLEAYGADGALRTFDNDQPIDDLGRLSSTDVDRGFAGVPELARALAESEQVEACVVTQWLRFARGADPVDACEDRALAARFRDDGTDLVALLEDFVASDDFIWRRTTGAGETP